VDQEFNGKVVWIVGASGAIGAEIAQSLNAAGAVAVISGRSHEKLQALASKLGSGHHGDDTVPLDVTSATQVNAAARGIAARHGRIDALVNSTSLSLFGDFLALDDGVWNDVLEVKLMGYIRSCRAVIPYMIEQGAGNIVNISGRTARQPISIHLPGGCANAAVNLLSKGLADQYYENNLRVNVVAPGPIESDRFARIQSTHEQTTKRADARPVLSRRMGLPSDVAQAVLWLLSDRSRHLTGTVMPVDGGSTVCL